MNVTDRFNVGKSLVDLSEDEVMHEIKRFADVYMR